MLEWRRSVFGSAIVLGLLWSVWAGAPAKGDGPSPGQGRTYELVSPVYKAGNRVNGILGVAPNGETVLYSSGAAFSGEPANTGFLNYYIARRRAEWLTFPEAVPPERLAKPYGMDFSPTLDLSIVFGKAGPNEGTASDESQEYEYLRRDTRLPDEASLFELIYKPIKPLEPEPQYSLGYRGANATMSHIVFEARLGTYILKEALGTNSNIYDLTDAGIKLIELNNKGQAIDKPCVPHIGSGTGRTSEYHAISTDGEEIFFSVGVNASECGTTSQLFMRAGGTRTIEISRPTAAGNCLEVPCPGASERAPAEFQGADEAGDRVFFTTREPLITGDKDGGNDIYLARIGCPGVEGPACPAEQRAVMSLSQISSGTTAAEVQGVVATAPDGSHAYFVARGVLGTEANSEGRLPVQGADNLYAYDDAVQSVLFIGDLCSGSERSGNVEDANCPETVKSGESGRNDERLWVEPTREAQVNECGGAGEGCQAGRYLIFTAFGRLSRSDTDDVKDVYRYDDSTGQLERVSTGEEGASEDGNSSGFSATLPSSTVRRTVTEEYDLDSRAISDDGRHIIFTTSEALAPFAINGVANVYEWNETGAGGGTVSLLSVGLADRPVEGVVTSSSSRDVFFMTTQGLSPEDTDDQADIYDARVEGGKPRPPASPEPCSGDACQGPLSNPAPLLVPGSAEQSPGENLPTHTGKRTAKPKKSKSKHRHKARSRRRRGRVRRSGGGRR